MDPLFTLVDLIIIESLTLAKKYFPQEELSISTVEVKTKNNEEYDFYAEELNKIAKLETENPTGLTFHLNDVHKTSSLEVKSINLKKPDTTSDFVGHVYLKPSNYEVFKAENIELLKVETLDGNEVLALTDEEFKVGVYFINLSSKSENTKSNKDDGEVDLETKLAEEKNKRLRLMADFENYKKRLEEERTLFGALANISILQEILEISDDINLAFSDENLDFARAKEVLKLTQDKLLGAAKNAGIEKVTVNVGENFDKEKMEAISTVPVTDETQKGKVIAVISSAYKYANRDGIIKAAKVVVGK